MTPVIGLQKQPAGCAPEHFGTVIGQVRTSSNPGGQLQVPLTQTGLVAVSEPHVPHGSKGAGGQAAPASWAPASVGQLRAAPEHLQPEGTVPWVEQGAQVLTST
jgi:hypothetical protein